MPDRFIQPFIQFKSWAIVLYEPLIYWTLSIIAAAGTAAAVLPDPAFDRDFWLGWAGLLVGSALDLTARGRAYAALPEVQRKSRWEEWKTRLLWSAIGLGFGSLLAYGINTEVLGAQTGWHPAVNAICVGVVALPLIDGSRAFARFMSGKSDVFGGLVLNWMERLVASRGGRPSGGEGA